MHRLVLPLLLSLPGLVSAQMFKDPALDALYAAERFDELGRIGQQRLAAAPGDSQALLAAAMGALRAGSEAPQREALIDQAEACVQRQPQAAVCHYVLGAVLGLHAAADGMLKLATSVGRVKTALQQALVLEPGWHPARSAVVEFYLLAPGIVGGSVAKAQEAVRAAPRPEQAKALAARVALHEGRHEEALAALSALPAPTDSALAGDLRGWARAAAFALVNEGRLPPARAHFERVMREQPDAAWAPYGLGRVLTDSGAPEQAVPLFEQATRLRGAVDLPIAYRAGIALQTLGRKEAAREALRRFVSAGKGSRANLDDAKKRLEQLGA